MGTVWLSIGQGLLFGAVCLLFGVWIARFVGLLDADAPAGETLGVGLTSGLLVLAVVVGGDRVGWTQLVHAGRGRVRGRDRAGCRPALAAGGSTGGQTSDAEPATDAAPPMPRPRRPPRPAVATWSWPSSAARSSSSRSRCVYGSTLIQSPRDGVQPTRGHGHRLLLDPRARPRPDRHGDDLLARRLRADRRACRTRPGITGARPGWRQPRSRSSAPRRWTPGTSSSCRCSSSRRPR